MKPAFALLALGAASVALGTTAAPATAGDLAAPPGVSPQPGAPGIGDPYFPLDGNGGYRVRSYDLDVRYEPSTDVLTGVATITARARQSLSSFNLDFTGLTVRSVTVNGTAANWTRTDGELTIIPQRPVLITTRFTTVVTYDGVPVTINDPSLGSGGVIHTDDGAVVIGQPHVAATWFPVNDHPRDKAHFAVDITVPRELEAVSNGALLGKRSADGWTTWRWRAPEPMAPYLATATVGEFDLRSYRAGGVQYYDAIDPDLFDIVEPPTGDQFAYSQRTDEGASYKRLMRTISVPADGETTMSFWVTRMTEPDWDHLFVEAHTAGEEDWTTLPDLNGHTSADVGASCPYWLDLHPFLTHYQTPEGDGCAPVGTSGEWFAASGTSDGAEVWSVDLSRYAGTDVEISISYVSDDVVQADGVFVDDIVVSTGEGSTSFEDDGDTFDGWTVPGAPAGSAPNPNDWIVGSAAVNPPTTGDIVEGSFARHAEIIDFLSGVAGEYPFTTSGGIVDDSDDVGYALENQTRPIYSKYFFTDSTSGDFVVVHELAHQWYGDSLAVKDWRHIWLNEGFATYAEWLWSEHEGLGTPQEIFDSWYQGVPADDPFWKLRIGDPGPTHLFDFPVYVRGAMTLQQLRVTVGDEDFFQILESWAQLREGDNVGTGQFKVLAETISGQQLDALFDAWLFSPTKPEVDVATGTSADLRHGPPAVGALLARVEGAPAR